MIKQTNALRANNSLSALVEASNQSLEDEIQRYSRMAQATWDVQTDDDGRSLLFLALRDPFGFASEKFAPDELEDTPRLAGRLHHLIGNLLQSSRRVSVAIQETTLSAPQLESLRTAMNSDGKLLDGHPRLQNQVLRINSDGTFVVRDLAVEVDEGAVEAAKRAILASGLSLRVEPLAQRPGVARAVQTLVERHLQDPMNPPRLVLWFRIDDQKDIHLLEIADDVADPGDGALDGVALGAGSSVPGARSVVIYLASPDEVHKAFEVNPGHPAIEAMRSRTGQIVYPPGDWQALMNEFPEIAHQPAAS